MMSDLPGDLLEEILCRVPAKSLKQLRSTCKQWNSLFNNERFTRKHLHKAAKQFLILMVKEFRVCSMNVNLHGNQPVEVTCDLRLIDSRSSLDQFEITQISHCDGLLLFSHEDHNRIVVWNTHWFASDEKEKQLGIFLLSFDYTTERFGRLLRLPYQCPCYKYVSLSVVREEKLSVLLQRDDTSSTEIWVTNKIGETKVVSWNKVLTFNFPPELFIWSYISFLVDEEKKVVVCCDKYMINELNGKILVHIVREDSKVQVDFGLVGECWPCLINYVPSLTQIQQVVARGPKRKR